MFYQKMAVLCLLSLLSSSALLAEENSIKLEELDGNWHLRSADGKSVRQARAILEFDSAKMHISGFDACNKISGTLNASSENNMSSTLIATKMVCRTQKQVLASKALHETLAEGFSVVHASSNGVDGILLKSQHHQLFFKKMGGEEKPKAWFEFDVDLDTDFDFGAFDFGSEDNDTESNQSKESL
ncbi:MAG TPA: META domain-containing protein [Sulfurovum sp.]|jgi:heat shock protein HslJ|nr:MAG: hypothetical protein B7Y63_00280 [Sulfurovum sp. 35-42-20]OYZ25650.1 MAG: hypothetical protein B7Y23_04580 [Sulfurovum sp. 16-42-52]OYZ49759.1 MAG: hypothetical protein B7Y13_03580 [Sulfurovum sp. 24-42-9]OZA45768.1 MAG: hypothetical protein B7X80_04220 [Sulfurovum sp. 17-42-90]OZA61580.1 MAG: hypothetical protein B7X69_00045 [Sulfurovum sp. 39-42-12]HQR74665.1 META domain-containing protein [Sulfurovum sp.]